MVVLFRHKTQFCVACQGQLEASCKKTEGRKEQLWGVPKDPDSWTGAM